MSRSEARQRRGLGLRGLPIALLSAAALLAAGPGTPSASAQPLITGVTNLDTNSQLAFDRTRSAGARFVRIQLYWAGAAPPAEPAHWDPSNPADPEYDWQAGDEAVHNALAAGLTPVLQVDGTPSWAQRCQAPSIFPAAICDPNPTDLAAFATAAAAHFSGRFADVPAVKYWQALNEPNLSLFFFPQFETTGTPLSPYLYRDLINAFYSGVKAAEPSDLVIAAGLGPIAVPELTVGPLRFARLMLCMTGIEKPHPTQGDCGGGVHFDIFAIHPYTTGAPTHKGGPDDVELGDLRKLQTLIAAADRAGRIKGRYRRTPLWVTEFSWDSKPPDPGGLPMKIETRWVAEALHTAWAAGVSHFFWYSLRDEARDRHRPFSETLQSGLYFRGATLQKDRPKPYLSAFRFPFVAYPGGTLQVWGRTPTSRPGRVAIQVKSGGGWRHASTLRANRNGIFQGRMRTSYGRDKKGAARAVFGHHASPGFSMRAVRDFHHPPFG